MASNVHQYSPFKKVGTKISPKVAGDVLADITIEGQDSEGGMLAATYDPTGIAGDVFDMDNMVEGANAKILTGTEKTKLAEIEPGADVTDTANVAAAGAIMNEDVINGGIF